MSVQFLCIWWCVEVGMRVFTRHFLCFTRQLSDFTRHFCYFTRQLLLFTRQRSPITQVNLYM